MDLETIRDHLERAERHVLLGDEHLRRYRDMVAQMERDGQDTAHARGLLQKFEYLQTLQIADRDHLREELAAISQC